MQIEWQLNAGIYAGRYVTLLVPARLRNEGASDISVCVKTIENRNDFFRSSVSYQIYRALTIQLGMRCVKPRADLFLAVVLAKSHDYVCQVGNNELRRWTR